MPACVPGRCCSVCVCATRNTHSTHMRVHRISHTRTHAHARTHTVGELFKIKGRKWQQTSYGSGKENGQSACRAAQPRWPSGRRGSSLSKMQAQPRTQEALPRARTRELPDTAEQSWYPSESSYSALSGIVWKIQKRSPLLPKVCTPQSMVSLMHEPGRRAGSHRSHLCDGKCGPR